MKKIHLISFASFLIGILIISACSKSKKEKSDYNYKEWELADYEIRSQFTETRWISFFEGDTIKLYFDAYYTPKTYDLIMFWTHHKSKSKKSNAFESCLLEQNSKGEHILNVHSWKNENYVMQTYNKRIMPIRFENNKIIIKNLADGYEDIEFTFVQKKPKFHLSIGDFENTVTTHIIYPVGDNYTVYDRYDKKTIYTAYPNERGYTVREGESPEGKIIYTVKCTPYCYYTVYAGDSDKKVFYIWDTKDINRMYNDFEITDTDHNRLYNLKYVDN